jgi:hypothetical protein
MALFDSFLHKKKKFRAACHITKEPLETGFGYLLSTPEVIQSKKYWDMVMTEPETMAYTVSHFRQQANGTHMRTLIFEKHASVSKPWIVSDSVINYFDVDKSRAREHAKKWWEAEGQYALPLTTPADSAFHQWKEYAILEAGRARVAL